MLALLADINQRLNLTIVLITHQLEVVKPFVTTRRCWNKARLSKAVNSPTCW